MSPGFLRLEQFVHKEMNEEDPLKEYNLFISKLSLKQIEDLSDEEIHDLAIERPGHPGQYDFLLNQKFFRSEAHLAETMKSLLDRLAKAKG
jgi:hypothetical protein